MPLIIALVIENVIFWIEDFIEINKRQKTHHTHTKYTIYIEIKEKRHKQYSIKES